MTAKLFPVTTGSSWPRPPELVRVLRQRQEGTIGSKGFGEVADAAVLGSLRCLEKAGVDIVTGGEQRGDNFYPFVADTPGGVKLMSVSDLWVCVPDRARFEETMRAIDVPAFAVKSAVAGGWLPERLRMRAGLKCRL